MMAKFLMICLAASLVAARASGQIEGDLITARSASGQFTARKLDHNPLPPRFADGVRAPMSGAWAFLLQPPALTPTNDMRLVPALLIVTCERIKNSLLLDLGLADEWRGRIDLFINSHRGEEEGTLLTAVRESEGWRYELELPAHIKARMLMRAIVQVLLLEAANRNAGDQTAEIPLWLIEGVSAHLDACNLPIFFVQPQVEYVANRFKLTEQDAVREQLRRNTALTFQQLCWPAAEDLAGDKYKLYSDCAQLFVEELLDLPDGRRGLYQMIQQLGSHLNWQTAFLLGFKPRFAQLLDVEKWWGLTCAEFSSQDSGRHGIEKSLREIQDALDVPVEVQFDTNRLATSAEITLEEAITEWKYAKVEPVLERAVQILNLLRWRIAPELGQLADAYRLTLTEYLRTAPSDPATLAYKKDTCRRLRQLDEQREMLRRKLTAAK